MSLLPSKENDPFKRSEWDNHIKKIEILEKENKSLCLSRNEQMKYAKGLETIIFNLREEINKLKIQNRLKITCLHEDKHIPKHKQKDGYCNECVKELAEESDKSKNQIKQLNNIVDILFNLVYNGPIYVLSNKILPYIQNMKEILDKDK